MAAETMNVRGVIPEILERLLNFAPGLDASAYVQQEYGRTNLIIGFGDQIDKWGHPLWEVGSYQGTWRILRGNKILLGSRDLMSEDEFNLTLKMIRLGKMIGLTALSDFDCRLSFSAGLFVDYLACAERDEVCHFFMPDNEIVVLNPLDGWRIGPADQAW